MNIINMRQYFRCYGVRYHYLLSYKPLYQLCHNWLFGREVEFGKFAVCFNQRQITSVRYAHKAISDLVLVALPHTG